MAMPETAQRKSRNLSGLSILIFTGFNKYITQNKSTLTPILTTFSPKGFTNCILVRCFTAERFMAKKMFVKTNAICATRLLFKKKI